MRITVHVQSKDNVKNNTYKKQQASPVAVFVYVGSMVGLKEMA
jgi:hypothetical protein